MKDTFHNILFDFLNFTTFRTFLNDGLDFFFRHFTVR